MDSIDDLVRMKSKLTERIEEWRRESYREGLKRGVEFACNELAENECEYTKDFIIGLGKQKGLADTVAQQVCHRFGPIAYDVISKIYDGSIEELTSWAGNVWEAEKLEDVFTDHEPTNSKRN